jgi:hypothetical protein
MPDPPAPYRCRYSERYYNRRQKEINEAAMKQKKKDEKEKRKQEKEKKEMAKKQKKVPPGLSGVFLPARIYRHHRQGRRP